MFGSNEEDNKANFNLIKKICYTFGVYEESYNSTHSASGYPSEVVGTGEDSALAGIEYPDPFMGPIKYSTSSKRTRSVFQSSTANLPSTQESPNVENSLSQVLLVP